MGLLSVQSANRLVVFADPKGRNVTNTRQPVLEKIINIRRTEVKFNFFNSISINTVYITISFNIQSVCNV
jgi:hypothetical protein